MSCYQQVCFAHGLQLAVVDILYKKNIEREEEHQEITSNESDTDDEDTNDTHEEQRVTVTTTTDPRNLHLSRAEKELQMQIQQDMKTYSINTKKEKDFEKILKQEMTEYESEGVRRKYLSSIHEYLLTIKPSVEAERAFSAAGYICSSVRSLLADDTINTIRFLRSFFQNQK
ncbi:hypothetical protein AVEN_49868-1 [Araneus ventricosus]|uniref:HAT C-terminal dimerisation domain-containing protein n=1 Tax=Araneus ventricosus TaxID=182803 RepID=A0A4Y2P118_ARAVE|nr:hypothetical protein AVEN_49868-1 [Araneus ventricosus]